MHESLDWKDYFLALAFIASRRSHDAETKHGCVLVDEKNRVLGSGYNGFPRGCQDHLIPRTRPAKYPWIIHSEVNAILNCQHRPEGATAYITGECCIECLKLLWQSGVTHVVQAQRHGSHLITDELREVRAEFLRQTGMSVLSHTPNLQPYLTALQEAVQAISPTHQPLHHNMVQPSSIDQYPSRTITLGVHQPDGTLDECHILPRGVWFGTTHPANTPQWYLAAQNMDTGTGIDIPLANVVSSFWLKTLCPISGLTWKNP